MRELFCFGWAASLFLITISSALEVIKGIIQTIVLLCTYNNIFPFPVVPVRKIHALSISWALPPQGIHYRLGVKRVILFFGHHNLLLSSTLVV